MSPSPPAGLEAPTTVIEPPDPETPDGSPAETTVIGPGPESETTILPEEALEDVADPDSPSGDSKAMTWVKRGLIIAGAAIVLSSTGPWRAPTRRPSRRKPPMSACKRP